MAGVFLFVDARLRNLAQYRNSRSFVLRCGGTSNQVPLLGYLQHRSTLPTTKGPFTYRRPSNNQRQCRPSKKVIQLKVCKENRIVACLDNILSSI